MSAAHAPVAAGDNIVTYPGGDKYTENNEASEESEQSNLDLQSILHPNNLNKVSRKLPEYEDDSDNITINYRPPAKRVKTKSSEPAIMRHKTVTHTISTKPQPVSSQPTKLPPAQKIVFKHTQGQVATSTCKQVNLTETPKKPSVVVNLTSSNSMSNTSGPRQVSLLKVQKPATSQQVSLLNTGQQNSSTNSETNTVTNQSVSLLNNSTKTNVTGAPANKPVYVKLPLPDGRVMLVKKELADKLKSNSLLKNKILTSAKSTSNPSEISKPNVQEKTVTIEKGTCSTKTTITYKVTKSSKQTLIKKSKYQLLSSETCLCLRFHAALLIHVSLISIT